MGVRLALFKNMEYSEFTYQELFDLANSKKLVLPNFQREFVWDIDNQLYLLASFLVNLPIGSFLILEGSGGEFVSKELCLLTKIRTEGQCFYLLDGQQRLSTIKNIFSDHFGVEDWKDTWDTFPSKLRYRWFLKVSNSNEEEDILGYNRLRFMVDNKDNLGLKKMVPKLSTLEPTEVINLIEYFQIHKTRNLDSFFHPAKRFEENDNYVRRLKLAELFASQNLLPLFDLFSNDKTIIKRTLKILAQRRVEALKSEVGDNFKLSNEILGHLNSQIEIKYKESNSKVILEVWNTLEERWIEDILEYFKDLFKSKILVPTVKANELARATSVFEFMNKGGTPLDNFDIIVAKFADIGAEETLYEKLEKILKNDIEIPLELSDQLETINYNAENFGIFKDDVLIKPLKEEFLNILSLNIAMSKEEEVANGFENVELKHIKKQVILSLKKEEIESQIDNTAKSLSRSLAFLQFRCGMDTFDRLSYRLMLLPLALILKDDTKWTDKRSLNRLEFWYWASLFAGSYRERQNQKVITDIKLLYEWIYQGKSNDILSRLDKVFAETNYSNLETLLLKTEDKSVPKAIKDGIMAYILSKLPQDFLETEKRIKPWLCSAENPLQDHHIIPLGSVTNLGISAQQLRRDKSNILNSPLNRTYISIEANNKIKSYNISKYLPILHNMAKHFHLLPDVPENELLFQPDNQFYENFMKERFKVIKSAILTELNNLKE